MANGNGQCVGGIVRLWDRLQLQQTARHIHHLFFLRKPIAYYRLLYLHGRIFVDGQMHFFRCTQDHTPGMSHCNAGGDIFTEKQFFNGHLIRPELLDQLLQIAFDLGQTRRQR